MRLNQQALAVALYAKEPFDQAAIQPGNGPGVEEPAGPPGRASVLVVSAAIVVGDKYRQLAPLNVIVVARTGNELAQQAEGPVWLANGIKAEDVEYSVVVIDRAVFR